MASELRVNTLKDASGNNSVAMSFVAEGSAKARHASSEDGATLFGSFNVSSLGDISAGVERINLSTSFADRNYSAVSGSGSDDNGSARITLIDGLATNLYDVNSYTVSISLSDTSSSSTAHGDLA
tara:strand:+ start:345 stop:719 length:375 start_codon:yes stop_codon:yes gene_type:complete